MRHDDAERLIASLALGGLEGEERQAVEIHVAQCEACRQALADLRATTSLLAEAVAALPREDLDAARRQAVLAAAQPASAPATPAAAAPEVPAAATVVPGLDATSARPPQACIDTAQFLAVHPIADGSSRSGAPVPDPGRKLGSRPASPRAACQNEKHTRSEAYPQPRRSRRLLWLGVGIAAGVVLFGLLLPALAPAREKRRSVGWSMPRPGFALRSAAASYDSLADGPSASASPFPGSAESAPSAGGPGMMGGAGGMMGPGGGMAGGMPGGGGGNLAKSVPARGGPGMMGGGLGGSGAIAPQTVFDAHEADKGTALQPRYSNGSSLVVGQAGDRRVAAKTRERWGWAEPTRPASGAAHADGEMARNLNQVRRPGLAGGTAFMGPPPAATPAKPTTGEDLLAFSEQVATPPAAAQPPRQDTWAIEASGRPVDGKANAAPGSAGPKAESVADDAYGTVAVREKGQPGVAGDRSAVTSVRPKVLSDSLSVATPPAPDEPASPAPPVVDYELGVAKEAKAAEAGADQRGPQEPALLAASKVTALHSQLNPGQTTPAGEQGQIQFSTAADLDSDALVSQPASRTVPLLGDVPVLGRLVGKEGAKHEAESADAATIRYYARAADPFAAGAEFRAKKPAYKDAAPEQEAKARTARPDDDSKRKSRRSREQAAQTPEAAARLLVEDKGDLAPADRERLSEVVRQSQVATLTREQPLSEEELAAPPPAPPSPVNPFVMTEKDRFSTFALEADTASYALARRYLANRRLPPPGLIRMEEFVNAFDYNYPLQSTRTFAIHAEAGPAPFGKSLTLLKVGVKAKVLGRDGRKPAHLVFVIDASGSMGREDRLPLVQLALGLLITQLDPRDRLSLVTYDAQARLLLEAVPAANAAEIEAAVGALTTGATTNLQAGVELGYQIAARHFRSGETNRVILCSDGVANVGPADAAAILAKVDQYRRQGITLTSVGVGSGSYDDRMLEQLANKGDGNYVFVDSPEQARRVFVDDFAGTLQMVARNAKIQVEFNPLRVRRYRLIGYENRDVADKDFRNDAVDAGEIGSGQAATALYELELLPSADDAATPPDLGTVYVRYENVDSGRVEEISTRLSNLILQDRAPERDPRFFLAACAAEFAENLRESEHARDGSLQALESTAVRVANALPLDQRAQELLTLVRKAEGLPR